MSTLANNALDNVEIELIDFQLVNFSSPVVSYDLLILEIRQTLWLSN